jgi:hypothetical protein
MIRGLVTLALTGFLGAAAATQSGQPAAESPQPDSPIPSGHPPIPLPKPAADWPTAKPEDVASIDAILKAFYEAPAGPPGQAREWDRFRSLFVPDARLIPARPGTEGSAGAFYLTVSDYIEANKVYFEKGGFFDTEIARTTESFANIVHVWSTYESRRKSPEAAPYLRGINSIQLLKDKDRYWIMNVFWDYERPDAPIPAKYLPAATPAPAAPAAPVPAPAPPPASPATANP